MQKVDFELTGEYIELNQLLKVVGLCDSGGAGKQIGAAGLIRRHAVRRGTNWRRPRTRARARERGRLDLGVAEPPAHVPPRGVAAQALRPGRAARPAVARSPAGAPP